MLYDPDGIQAEAFPRACLNAPFGARCFMTGFARARRVRVVAARLNAPFGARCFMTRGHPPDHEQAEAAS